MGRRDDILRGGLWLPRRLDHPALELGDQRRAPLLAYGVALAWRQAVDLALDIEQGIDASARRRYDGYGPGQGKTDTGRLWTYVRDDRPFGGANPPAAVFYYSRDRRGDRGALQDLTLGLEPEDGVIWVYGANDDDGTLAFTLR